MSTSSFPKEEEQSRSPAQPQAGAQSRTRALRGPLVALAAWLLAAAYLGGIPLLVPFVLLVGGVLLPMAALTADALRGGGLSDELRVCVGGAFALLVAIPLYYLRRALPLPPALFDATTVVLATGAALRAGALRRYARAALSPLFRAVGWLLAGVVPFILCMVWLGFEVRRGATVSYYGLFMVDFSNLAEIVSMIKASAGPPQFMMAGAGPLHYHWWFFAIAAWLSGFAGLDARSSSALALSNLLVAVLLGATICGVVAAHLRARTPALSERVWRHLTAASAAIVIVAPFSVYA